MTAGDVSEALPPLAAALRDARVSVLDHWERREAGGHGADEELLTHLLLDAAEPLVHYVDFNRRQEGVVGADWLWWFVDDDGTCFGLLAQAKKLNGAVGGWTVDLGYPGGTQRQLTGLLRASDRLAVPAAYVVYFGRRARRPDVACSVEDAPDCWRCERSGVAVLPALVARQIALSALPYHPEELAPDSYKNSVPLEDLGLPDSAPVRDVNLGAVSAELRDFLLNEQGGARGVAKRIFRVISDDRRRSLSHAAPEARPTDALDLIFDELPVDTGHFGVSYFEHLLRGLRGRPPAYLTDLLGGSVPIDPPAELEGVAGIVIVQM